MARVTSMSLRNLVAAVTAAVLVGGPALAANQQDWARCRGNDPALALSSCGRIISDQAEAAPNRADAYLLRAGASFARGDIDAAIADDGEAIKLVPENIAAYVNQALAYFHKGDRDRAVIDFAVADRLDAARTDEIAAANPALAQIAAIARGSPPAAAGSNDAARAGPFCPTSETARNGFVLINQQEARSQRVHPSNGDVATYDYFEGDERAMSATYYKGLLILFASFLDTYINSYDIDYTRLGVYQVGQEALYHALHVTLDGKVTSVTVERRVVGAEKLVIGDCTFDTFVVESKTQFPDGTKTVGRSNFSPELKMSLHFTTTSEGSEPYEVGYDRIAPLTR